MNLDWASQIPYLGDKAPWIGQVFVVVLAALVADFFARRAIARLRRRADATRTPWDEAILESLRPPLTLLIWVVGLGLAAEVVLAATGAPLFEAAKPLRDVGVIGALTWFLLRMARAIQRIYVARHTRLGDTVIDASTAEALGKLVRLAILITAVLVVLQTLGYSVSGVLAFGGIGGIAVGFAARDLLANFFGAIMVYSHLRQATPLRAQLDLHQHRGGEPLADEQPPHLRDDRPALR